MDGPDMRLFDFLNFRKRAESALVRELEATANLVKVGLYARLVERYSQEFELENAKFLAAAVTNEAFSDQPSDGQAITFLERQRPLVEEKLRELSKDYHVCNVLTQTLAAWAMVPLLEGATADAWIDPLEKLQRYGILIPGGSAPELKQLIPLVTEFYKSRSYACDTLHVASLNVCVT